jgi:peptide/nickel transport system substrate-binding protein
MANATLDGTMNLTITRRTFLQGVAGLGIGAAAGLASTPRTGGITPASATAARGGTLRVAEIGEPLTLDAVATTADLTTNITLPVFEELFALDANGKIQPFLVSSYTASQDGLTYTFTLRRDVPFHNGKQLGAEDVVASLDRWGRVSPRGSAVYKDVEAVSAPAADTVIVRLKNPFAPLLAFLAFPNGAAAIMPKEIVEATGSGPLKQYVGTGPYKFVEWAPDRYVKLARFDQYAARPEPPSGYAGRREALADTIMFFPVAQVATRIAGVQSGDYDIADNINLDAYAQLAKDPRVVPEIVKPGSILTFFFNTKQGVMANVRLRQAALAAMDMQPIMQATFGNPALYSLDPSFYPKGSPWYTSAGASLYNQHDPARARRLLEEAGYRGQPVRWLTTMQYDYMFKSTVVAAAQLQQAGFKIDTQVIDWASVLDRRAKPAGWDMFTTSGGFPPDPAMETFLSPAYPGWWSTSDKAEAFDAFTHASDPRRRAALWARLQDLIYTEVPLVRPGDFFGLVLTRRGIEGFHPAYWIITWNVQVPG